MCTHHHQPFASILFVRIHVSVEIEVRVECIVVRPSSISDSSYSIFDVRYPTDMASSLPARGRLTAVLGALAAVCAALAALLADEATAKGGQTTQAHTLALPFLNPHLLNLRPLIAVFSLNWCGWEYRIDSPSSQASTILLLLLLRRRRLLILSLRRPIVHLLARGWAAVLLGRGALSVAAVVASVEVQLTSGGNLYRCSRHEGGRERGVHVPLLQILRRVSALVVALCRHVLFLSLGIKTQ